MCGILFYLDKKKNISKDLEKKLNNTSKEIIHRGPDFNKSIVKKNLYFFHSRLIIQDINKRSHQPMIKKYKMDNFLLLYNGEIYNFNKIKKKISRKIKFQTSSDTEVLLNNFIINNKNPNFISDFDGMFAFLIYDERKNQVTFGRDFFGQKPLYFYEDDKKIIISSEIKPIINLVNKAKRKLDQNKLKDYFFENNYFMGRKTFHENIYQVLPGEVGIINNNEIYFQRIYSNLNVKKKKISISEYFKLLEKNIIDHTISDKKISLSLSSGLDSSLIAHVIYKYVKKKYDLTAYTFDFENHNYEYNEARKFVRAYNQKIKKITVTQDYVINNFEKLFKQNEGPIGGISQFGLYKICNQAKKDGFDVMLSGYGLDESLGSYKSIKSNLNKQKFDLINLKNLSNEIYKSKNQKKTELLNIINDYFFKIKIPRTTQMVDRSSMSNSIEMRIPFLEKNFVESTLQWSDYKNNIDKYLIRKYLQKNSNYKKNWLRPKIHVPHPQNIWLREGKLSNWTYDILKESYIYKKIDFIDKKKILNAWSKFKQNKSLNGYVFWQLINLFFLIQQK